MPTREEWIQQRIGARYVERGEQMTLRRVTTISGPGPSYPNPPDVSSDLLIATGIAVGGQAYFGITGSSIIGRLVAGDQVQCLDNFGNILSTWTVQVMPGNIATDTDGIPLAAGDGTPTIGTPTPYSPDAIAANDTWTVIPVTAPGAPDPALSIGNLVALVFQADQVVYGVQMKFERMLAMGWTEMDSLGVDIAAYNAGAIVPPKVNDMLIVAGQLRSIMNVGDVARAGTHFLYPVQAR